MDQNELIYKLSFALDCADSINWELSPDLKKIIFSDNLETMYGIKQKDYNYEFEKFVEIYLKPYKEEIYSQLTEYFNGKTNIISTEISLLDGNGRIRWLVVRGKFINEERKLMYGVSVDITERKALEQRLASMAYIDANTGLYKQEYIADAILGRIALVKPIKFGLIMINIRRFRDINAVFGYKRGNKILVHVAAKLEELTDGIIAKLDAGGLIVIVNNAKDVKKLEEIALSLINFYEEKINIDGQAHFLEFKIGLVPYATGKPKFEAMMKDAEMAISYIRDDELTKICAINAEIRRKADEYFSMGFYLRKAIKEGDLILYFQPLIDGESKRIKGAEALIRWNHHEDGIMAPARFIPLAEETGLINQIGEFVLFEAMKQLKIWLKQFPDFYMSINVSATQLMTTDLASQIEKQLMEHHISPDHFVVEITENVFIADEIQIINSLNTLRNIGIKISLDDFGTGYSSLGYLKKLPLDNLKIDQSFLQDVFENPISEAILKTIISLARNLNLSITAEGVETLNHLELLNSYGCDYLQGYYFSKPLPAADFEKFVKNY